MLSLPLVSPFPLGPSLGQGSLLRPGRRLSRPLRPGGRLSRPLRPALTYRSHSTSPPICQSHLTPPLTCQSHLTSQRSTQCPFTSLLSRPPCPGGLLSHWSHMDLALRPLPRFHLRSTALLEYALCKRLEAALRGGGSVMNLVAIHSNCTSPMDYISHHALHSHIPFHHYTNHTAVTIHSLVLIVSPHLHLIHSHTFKQHSHMHSLRSLVLPWLTFPSGFPCVSTCVLPGPLTLSPDRLLPALLTPPAYWLSSLSAACPDPLLCLCLRICLIYVALDTTV